MKSLWRTPSKLQLELKNLSLQTSGVPDGEPYSNTSTLSKRKRVLIQFQQTHNNFIRTTCELTISPFGSI